MRALGYIAVLALLPGCQMGLPAATSGSESAPVIAQEVSAEANLAAAFEQAALAAQVAPEPEKKGFLGFLKPKAQPAPAVLAGTDIEVVDGALTDDEDAQAAEAQTEAQTGVVTGTPEQTRPAGEAPVLETTEPVKSGLGGLFGFLKPKNTDAPTQAALKAPNPENAQDLERAVPPQSETPEMAEDATEALAASEPAPETTVKPKKPLFGFLAPKDGADKARKKSRSTVALGETLPFGTVGISCEARPKDMGKRVDQFPSAGSASWQIYDTAPSSTAPRTQFITGFKDGCARQVTAALILFGSPSLHEVHRYAKARSKVSWSKADNSYESLKSKVCGVGRKTPCPSGKLGQLEKQMAFVSIYKQFGDDKGWLELLLHDGKMETQELR